VPSILDLYSGCGGLSLGAHQAGFSTTLAIDSDPILSSSFELNFPAATVLRSDIREVDAALLKAKLPSGVDGVVGGPPCQAFSEIGRRDSRDPRRKLVREFFRIVAIIVPKFFLFENVRGLAFDENIRLLKSGMSLLGSEWQLIGPCVLNAADFGAPTRRHRLFLFGFNAEKMAIPEEGELLRKSAVSVCVRDAIHDLVTSRSLGFADDDFEYWAYDKRRTASTYAAVLRSRDGIFTGHHKTIHKPKTIRRFSKLKPGEQDPIGKYTRLDWDGLCPTLRAGTGNDRGSYQAVRPIHPEEDRVITPREAARLQGFPDDFLFHPTVWHSCRMIGNSVSPIIAKTLLERIARFLETKPRAVLPVAAE
jgi:DNA (cytosine-5)-methyltransferase 1